MNAYIVTGASRGLGAALVAQLLAQGGQVFAIARDTGSLPAHAQLMTLDADLADSSLLPLLMQRALAALGTADSITLINNAGTVQPIAQVGAYPAGEAERAIALNLTAPLLLCDAFIAHSHHHHGLRRVLNISSGAAATPYAGWSVYCASKAGIDHFTRTLAVEQAATVNPVRAVSLYPGVIDTTMQSEIRAADVAQFPGKARFDALKADGQLSTPAAAASAIISYLHSSAFGSVPVMDIRQL